MAKLLIVDDEKNIRTSLAAFFGRHGYEVRTAESGQQALALLSEQDALDLVLTDYRMAEMSGYELLKEIKGRDPDLMVILMTAYATVEGAVAAMKAGAYDYLTKPFSLDQVEHAVERALETRRLRSEVRGLRETLEERPFLESRSAVMRRLFEDAKRVAGSEATILLTGESGTGKNVLARQIHLWSPRREKAFVVINCTTLSEQLLESELFGHVKGAFTGAIKDKPGRLEVANGGTVFLDEIADLSAALQAKFLRFVQEQSFERVGGESTIHVEARIIAASNRDLPGEVAAHHFREDLFYRLNVIALRIPSLRERPEDILPLAERLLAAAAIRNRRSQLRFSPDAQTVLANYSWPGNVRELRNAVERAVVISRSDLIGPECLPDALFQPPSAASAAPSPSSLEDLERQQIMRVLTESPTLQDAAERLGINVTTLWRKRKRYRLE
ncbi:MAG TPA: sigma-54 dependent transcriptional regulator [Candidatus Binataceae bacterium]|nr:sigma-54 dependent transcriptional regulator [Candidatus Binataceae bacterium]HYB89404.1 sigma-54 dependent transcriptional regulator [Candidatus Binataceae bacterium]